MKEACIGKIKNAADEVHNIVKKTDVSEIQTEVDKLTNQYSSEELAAALLSSVADLEKQNTPVEITRERPLPRRRNGSGSRNGGGRGGDRRGNGGGYRGGNRSGGSRNGGGNRERRGNSERRFGDYKRRDGRSNEGRSNNSSRQRREFTVREKD